MSSRRKKQQQESSKKKKKKSIAKTPLEKLIEQQEEKTLVIHEYLNAKVETDNTKKISARLSDFHGQSIASVLREQCKCNMHWQSRQNIFSHLVSANIFPLSDVNKIGSLVVGYLPCDKPHVAPIAQLAGVRFQHSPRPLPDKLHDQIKHPKPLQVNLSLQQNGEFLYDVTLQPSLYVERIKGQWYVDKQILTLVYSHHQQYQDATAESTLQKQMFWIEFEEFVFHEFQISINRLTGVPVLCNGPRFGQTALSSSSALLPREHSNFHGQFDGPYRYAKINVPVNTNIEERASWSSQNDDRFKPPDYVRIPFRTAISTRGTTLKLVYAQRLTPPPSSTSSSSATATQPERKKTR